jgi:hypothetical protein
MVGERGAFSITVQNMTAMTEGCLARNRRLLKSKNNKCLSGSHFSYRYRLTVLRTAKRVSLNFEILFCPHIFVLGEVQPFRHSVAVASAACLIKHRGFHNLDTAETAHRIFNNIRSPLEILST